MWALLPVGGEKEPDLCAISRRPVSARIPELEKILTERDGSLSRWQCKLLLGKSYIEAREFIKAQEILDGPDLKQSPLWEFAARYLIEAREGMDAKYYSGDIWKKLYSAEGEPSFRNEAAGNLGGAFFSSGKYDKALPYLEGLAAFYPDNLPLKYKLAKSYHSVSRKDLALPIARKLYLEYPAAKETQALFEECPALAPDASGLTREEIAGRLLRMEDQGGFFRLEKELPFFESSLDPDSARFLKASLLAYKKKIPEAVGLYLQTPPSSPLHLKALERCVSNLAGAKAKAPEIEKKLIAIKGAGKEKVLKELFKFYKDSSLSSDAARVARELLAFQDADAAEFIYKGGWNAYLGGNSKKAAAVFTEFSKALPVDNDYHQAALFSLLEMGALSGDQAETAKGELLAYSRYGYYGYRLREGMPPSTEAGTTPLLPPILSPAPQRSRRFKAALLVESGLGEDAVGELEELIRVRSKPELLWELALVASRAKIYPKSVRAARKLYPNAYTAEGDAMPKQAWEMIYPLPYFESFEKNAKEKGVPLPTLYSIARQESLFDVAAVSKAGARGMIQLMPATARMVAKKNEILLESEEMLNDVDVNLDIGSRYFLSIYRQFDGSLPMALAGYNAGPGRPMEWNKRPNNPQKETLFIESIPFRETRSYVKRIMNNLWEYKRLYPDLKEK